jgi:hypothetical protein
LGKSVSKAGVVRHLSHRTPHAASKAAESKAVSKAGVVRHLSQLTPHAECKKVSKSVSKAVSKAGCSGDYIAFERAQVPPAPHPDQSG